MRRRAPLLLSALALALACASSSDLPRAFEREPSPLTEHILSRADAGDVARTREAARAGEAWAQARLALMYQYGWGVAPDPQRAFHWCERAAEQGHAAAEHHLGLLYLRGVRSPPDIEAATRWLRRAVDREHEAGALASFASLYLDPRGMPHRASEAYAWTRDAAHRGLARAQYGLALVHLSRAPEDERSEGVAWLREAAAQGHVQAQFRLGVVYLDGTGVERDVGRALHWFRQAARQDHPRALYNLGLAHRHGWGVEPDAVEAYRWQRLAVEAGHPLAAHELAQLGARLSPAQIQAAETRVRRWYERRE